MLQKQKRAIGDKAIEPRTELKKNGPQPYYHDTKLWIYPSTQVCFVRRMFTDMADAHSDSKDFKNAIKLVERCLILIESGSFDKYGNSLKKRYIY